MPGAPPPFYQRDRPVKMRSWLPLLAASVLALVTGCGSSNSSSGNGTIRLVNATNSATYDFYNGTSLLASNIAPAGASGYASLPAAAYPFYVNTAGTSTAVNGSTRVITGTLASTLVVYATGGTIATAQLTDNQTAPTSGQANFRIFNTSNEAGAVDVYVTAATVTDLSTVSPIATNIVSSRLSGYVGIAAGSYRIRVTGTGDITDIRLDLPAVRLADQEVATMVLTTAAGGTLVNAVNIDQLGATTAYNNPATRLRLVANATNRGTVGATTNGVALDTLASPAISSQYKLVPAGALTTSITINGTAVTVPALTSAAGTDATLFVGGSATAPTITLITDDNAVPTVATQTKLRLFNGVNGLTGSLSMTADFGVVASNIAYGAASTAVTNITGSTSNVDTHQLQVTANTSGTLLYNNSVALRPAHVYTMFVLGDSTSVSAQPRLDR